jgi:hypothetical protein
MLSLFAVACGGRVLLGEREPPSGAPSSGGSAGSSGTVAHTLSCNGAVDTLATACASTMLLAVDDQTVYFQAVDCRPGSPILLSVPRRGGIPTFLLTNADSDSEPYGRFTLQDQSIWFTDGTAMFTMPKTGGKAHYVNAWRPYLGTPVSDGNDIYVADDEDGIIQLSAAGTATVIVHDEVAFALAVDATNLYWMGGIFPDGPNPLRTVAKTGGTPVSLASDLGQSHDDDTTTFVDPETQLRFVRDGDAIYWGNRRDHQLVRYPTSGATRTVLAQGDAAGWIVSMTVYNGWVVWLEGRTGLTRRLFAMPVAGGDARQIASVDPSAWALVADATGFYFTTNSIRQSGMDPGAVKHIACTWQ